MANYLITGVAGFIAARVAELLLDAGHTVVGIDNLNDAYDVRMKEHRLGKMQSRSGLNSTSVPARRNSLQWSTWQPEPGFGNRWKIHGST
jgi:nucleoside-diphosphate-sugar epimerase